MANRSARECARCRRSAAGSTASWRSRGEERAHWFFTDFHWILTGFWPSVSPLFFFRLRRFSLAAPPPPPPFPCPPVARVPQLSPRPCVAARWRRRRPSRRSFWRESSPGWRASSLLRFALAAPRGRRRRQCGAWRTCSPRRCSAYARATSATSRCAARGRERAGARGKGDLSVFVVLSLALCALLALVLAGDDGESVEAEREKEGEERGEEREGRSHLKRFPSSLSPPPLSPLVRCVPAKSVTGT